MMRLRVVNGNAHRYLGMYGFPSECELYTIAADGIYYDSPRSVSHGYVFVSIGSRVDLLVQARETRARARNAVAPFLPGPAPSERARTKRARNPHPLCFAL